MFRMTVPGQRAAWSSLEAVVPEGMDGAFVFGGTMEASLANLWLPGAGDLTVIGNPTVGPNYLEFQDGTSMLQSLMMDTGPGTWMIAAASVDDAVSILVGSNAASLPGQYGEAAYFSNAGNFRYRRDTDNAGASFPVDIDVANDVSTWTLYLCGNDGALAYARNLTSGGTLYQGTITYPAAKNTTNPFRLGGDYVAGTVGKTRIGAVWRWRRWLSAAERDAAAAELRANKPTLAI